MKEKKAMETSFPNKNISDLLEHTVEGRKGNLRTTLTCIKFTAKIAAQKGIREHPKIVEISRDPRKF